MRRRRHETHTATRWSMPWAKSTGAMRAVRPAAAIVAELATGLALLVYADARGNRGSVGRSRNGAATA